MTSHADPDLVGVRRDVVVPARVARRRGTRRDDQLGVTRGGLTRIVDRLVERGWIERDRPASNGREVYAVLTADGQRAIKHARAIYVGILKQTLGTHLR